MCVHGSSNIPCLCCRFSSVRKLVKLESVQFILDNHTVSQLAGWQMSIAAGDSVNDRQDEFVVWTCEIWTLALASSLCILVYHVCTWKSVLAVGETIQSSSKALFLQRNSFQSLGMDLLHFPCNFLRECFHYKYV